MLLLGLALGAAHCAANGDPSATTPPDASRATPCVAGLTVACPCPGGSQGTQTCDAATGAFAPCACSASDGGTLDAVTPDATLDATTPDATTPDAPPADVVTPTDGPRDGGVPGDVPAAPQTLTYAISAMTIDQNATGGAPVPATSTVGVAGFDLDGLRSTAADAAMVGNAACGHSDFFSTLDPDQNGGTCAAGAVRGGTGCLGGVDNQLPEVVNTTMGFGIDGRAGLSQSIRQGQTAMVLRITDVNGTPGPTLNDPSVRVFVYRYAHPTFANCAMIGTPGLTYAIDNASLTVPGDLDSARLQYAGRIVNGRLVVERPADPASARLDLPLAVTSTTPFQLPLRGVQLRFDLTADRGLRGNLGGSASLAAIASALAPMLPAGIPPATVQTVLQSLVDVQDPAGSAVGCTAPNGTIGMGLGFEATRVALAAGTVSAAAPGTCGATPTPVPTCFTQDSADPFCPSAAVSNPGISFRVTHMTILTPAVLASPIVVNVLNEQVRAGRGLWGLSLALTSGLLRIGAFNPARTTRGTVGQGLFDGRFPFFAGDATGPDAARWDPQSVAFRLDAAGAVNSAEATGIVRLPTFQPDGSLLVELPLARVRLSNVRTTASRGCIGLALPTGGRFNECTSGWFTAGGGTTPYAHLDAAIAVSAARTANVAPLMTTLCNLLAGSNCATVPQAMWTRQPDTTVGTEPAYSFSADIAAVAATVVP